MNRDQLLSDFSPFTDIGEEPPKIALQKGKFTVRFIRDGRELKLVIDSTTGVVQSTLGKSPVRHHTSVAALLASELFANLRRWAEVQRDLLSGEIERRMIPVNASTHDDVPIKSINEVSKLLGSAARPDGAAEVLLIDGPAGIGKTNLIVQLALERATSYKSAPTPLILHIKSRGRVLSNLDDLMAFSLQTIRSTVTYDQVPVLVRHGLIVAAIDGFDELGDPNGYDTAWGQLSELIAFVRGKGTLILAGRDTFISRARLLKDVSSLRESIDIVNSLTLLLPSPQQAKEWLRNHNWTEANLEIPSISVLLDENSFALRPVFLRLLAENIKPKDIKGEHERFLTSFLLKRIIAREAKLFGKAVQAVMSIPQIEAFIENFMLETAREMADMQAEALDATTLSWIAEAALGDGYSAEIVGLIKNRAAVVALLMNDERPGYRAFVHTHIQNYFLAKVAVEAVSRGDTPKFIRRNILGAEFLSTFIDVVSECSSEAPSMVSGFLGRAQNLAQTYPHLDRGARNLGALLLASFQCVRAEDEAYFAGFQVDDAVTRGTAGPTKVSGVVINQIDCRQADLSALEFKETSIISVIADDASRFSSSFPVPRVLVDEGGAQLSDAAKIAEWLDKRGRSAKPASNLVVSDKVKKHRVYAVLGRACRMRQYWLRDGDDDVHAERVLKDPNWPTLSSVLKQNGFLRIEKRDASGGASPFYHIRHSERLLSERSTDTEVVKFFKDLDDAI
ncbi:MAG: hypothetical protein ACT6SF_00380 [Hydrogenophaga sp.]|jgi:hypothetical protein|uniref:hypothetical protein n=1 Tax=Hydrogenophaga sp. TaxID=1904254 RepID=UPI001DCB8C6F|nr:hypothetical protein [Hydrogenophaga sp.]MBW0170708.1 hypothetical protein [Hydrogenophaga sp.]MBW0185545.1 hypothetical protein [Hydrogenophaga sp.]